jgi:hypothetical protein
MTRDIGDIPVIFGFDSPDPIGVGGGVSRLLRIQRNQWVFGRSYGHSNPQHDQQGAQGRAATPQVPPGGTTKYQA